MSTTRKNSRKLNLNEDTELLINGMNSLESTGPGSLLYRRRSSVSNMTATKGKSRKRSSRNTYQVQVQGPSETSENFTRNLKESLQSLSTQESEIKNKNLNSDNNLKTKTQILSRNSSQHKIKFSSDIQTKKAFSMFADSKILNDIIQLQPFLSYKNGLNYHLKENKENNLFNNFILPKGLKILFDGAFQYSFPLEDSFEGNKD